MSLELSVLLFVTKDIESGIFFIEPRAIVHDADDVNCYKDTLLGIGAPEGYNESTAQYFFKVSLQGDTEHCRTIALKKNAVFLLQFLIGCGLNKKNVTTELNELIFCIASGEDAFSLSKYGSSDGE